MLAPTIAAQYLAIRVAVAALAESATPPWWRTNAWSPVARRLLQEQLYPRTYTSALIHATTLVARRDHDDSLGRLGAYHLFRLPPELEAQVMGRSLVNKQVVDLTVRATEGTLDLNTLLDLSGGMPADAHRGPVKCGVASDVENPGTPGLVAAHYAAALENGLKVVPYFGWDGR
jgi:hypothetical protein